MKKFKKRSILGAKEFVRYRDLLNVLLDDDTMYSLSEVRKILKKRKEGR